MRGHTDAGPVGGQSQRYHVVVYGRPWSLDLGSLKTFLRDGADGKPWKIESYGTPVSRNGRTMNEHMRRSGRWSDAYLIWPLDWEPEEFAYALAQLEHALK